MPHIFLIELNEINFEFIEHYAKRGRLPNLSALIRRHGIIHTQSEVRADDIEPWIQWVSAHTGKTLAEHGAFRLGDSVGRNLHQIWEHLENAGLKVGAISPMNAENRTQRACFFVPDPWTNTHVTGGMLLRRLHASLRQAVNDNAGSHLSLATLFWLSIGMVRYARPINWRTYAAFALKAIKKPWKRALILDLLLSDIFRSESITSKIDFGSLFLNAGAHIQHHYMFNSAAYSGDQSNPEWYIPHDEDPTLEVYELYDSIIGNLLNSFKNSRFLIATALHQDPHGSNTYYWRIADHQSFLKSIGIQFERVEERMSRDFLVIFQDKEQAKIAENRLNTVLSEDGVRLFDVDNRGSDLFVTLSYPNDIPPGFHIQVDKTLIPNFRQMVNFVAIKNGQHNGMGYLVDTARSATSEPEVIEITELPMIICKGFGLNWTG